MLVFKHLMAKVAEFLADQGVEVVCGKFLYGCRTCKIDAGEFFQERIGIADGVWMLVLVMCAMHPSYKMFFLALAMKRRLLRWRENNPMTLKLPV